LLAALVCADFKGWWFGCNYYW